MYLVKLYKEAEENIKYILYFKIEKLKILMN